MNTLRLFCRRFINICRAIVAMTGHGFPQRNLILVGITGTDGKTTTSALLANILQAAGHTVGCISTLGANINGQHLDTGLHVSTPGPAEIYKLLRLMKQAGVSHVVVETTSHGLDQYRTFGLTYQVGLILNISPEHLDYHHTLENYVAAKAKIINHSKQSVINLDSQPLAQLAKNYPGTRTFSLEQAADFQAQYVHQSNSLTVSNPNIAEVNPIALSLPGRYNAANALAAIAAALILEIKPSAISRGLSVVNQVEGRWHVIQDKPFHIIIDFAHTPQSFAHVLPQAKSLASQNGRLIHVFGSAAQRDQDKRVDMGQLSGQWADYSILTMEDPRHESLDTIQAMIIQGLSKQGRVEGQHWQRIDDRQQAINQAIVMAEPGDVVLITGKGHEKSLAIQGQEIPWSEEEAVMEALKLSRQKAKGKTSTKN